jgi:hypothetical protein
MRDLRRTEWQVCAVRRLVPVRHEPADVLGDKDQLPFPPPLDPLHLPDVILQHGQRGYAGLG